MKIASDVAHVAAEIFAGSGLVNHEVGVADSVLVLALQIAYTVVEKGVAADAEVFASVFASLVAVVVAVAAAAVDAAAVAGFVAAEMVCSSLLYQTLVSSHTEGENL